MASVATTHQINVPAASMRLSRLRKLLDSRVGQSDSGTGGDDASDLTSKAAKTKAPETPNSKAKRSTPATAKKANGSETETMTPTPTPKNKKRKLAKVEPVENDQTEPDGSIKTRVEDAAEALVQG